jgi:hypothetical protein
MNKASRTDSMSRGKAAHWKSFGDLTLQELIVSPERAREIHEKLWPENLMRGRPGVMYTPQPGETLQQRIPRRVDEPPEIEVCDAWRVTHEFDGNEESLPAVEEEVELVGQA